ncbi:CmpA/NrtA family ABC transporter substrate-binding protein [Azospirillum sp. ST 5-10]|uniref:CmpA/NrtA family ABC transporter substrate-binding protein n=1 Tax=unclassified Azospirillum TaxID=2630922 RepID=UPI003F49C564
MPPPSPAAPRPVRVGFIPLIDCAIPVVAAAKGFAAAEGLDLQLSREASWAAVRDKVAFGGLDCAHMLAGMPIAATLGLGQVTVPMVAPMSLGLGGNAITVAADLHAAMRAADPAAMAGPPGHAARALKAVIEARRARGLEPLVFAMVFPVSSHNYELRCWMAAAGIDPDADVALVVVPPPRMVESLEAGHIAGFCVGEPWNRVAVDRGLGRVVATKADIWPASPEKVLGMRADWAEGNGAAVAALVRACVRAAVWADAPENRAELAALLAEPRHVGAPARLIEAAVAAHHVFYRSAATFPWVSQAEWVIGQMRRWGQIGAGAAAEACAARVFRPDLYRAALAGTGLPAPRHDRKEEGAHATGYTVEGTGGEAIPMAADRWLAVA